MRIKIFCKFCNKSREIKVMLVKRGTDLFFRGECPYCGTYWIKKVGKKSEYIEHNYEQWYKDYPYLIKDPNFRGIESDEKIEGGD